jgi:hypothetical protein
MMSKIYKKEKFVSAIPGQTFVMQANKLKAIEPSTPFLTTAPRDSWPSRDRTGTGEPPDYAPATGRRELVAGDLDRLHARLNELAASLVGGTLFKSLYSLLASELPDRKLTFVVLARSGGDHHAFEYAPTRCTFERVAGDPAGV